MPRKPSLDDLKKRASLRLKIFLIFLMAWLVVDEWLKEGYFFDLSDLTQPLTHEFFFVVLLSLEAMLLLIPRLIRPT